MTQVPDRIVWHEGMLLAPQHFQQAEARVDALVAWHTLATNPFGWGVRSVTLDAALLQAGIRMKVVSEHAAAEVPEQTSDQRADPASPDDPGGLAGQVEPNEPVQREVAVTHPVVGAVNPSVQRQNQRDGVLGHRIGRIRGHPHDDDAETPGGVEIDIVEARAAEEAQQAADTSLSALANAANSLGTTALIE